MWDKTWVVSKNKNLEMQLVHHNTLFEFTLGLYFRGMDHAGPYLEVALFNYEFAIRLYDHRHWSRDTNTWEVHNVNSGG